MRILIALLLFSNCLNAQELYVGGNVGLGRINPENYGMASAQLEYIPKVDKLSLSLNAELATIFVNNGILLSAPLYLKVMFGRKFRVSPFIGAFVRSNIYYGPTFDGMLDIHLRSRLLLSFKVDRNIDFYTVKTPSHINGNSTLNEMTPSTWLSLGLRWN